MNQQMKALSDFSLSLTEALPFKYMKKTNIKNKTHYSPSKIKPERKRQINQKKSMQTSEENNAKMVKKSNTKVLRTFGHHSIKTEETVSTCWKDGKK